VPLVAGLLAVLGIVISHDPGPGLRLSGRGWFTIGLAALLAVLLAIHRNTGQRWALLRALAEYTVVGMLALLLVTATGMQQPPAPAAKHPASRASVAATNASDTCPSIVQLRDWLACLWHASQEPNRRDHSTPTTTQPHQR